MSYFGYEPPEPATLLEEYEMWLGMVINEEYRFLKSAGIEPMEYTVMVKWLGFMDCEPTGEWRTCEECNGFGVLEPYMAPIFDNALIEERDCYYCKGTGLYFQERES